MPRYFLGLDIGTTGTKALLIDDGGRVVASATAEHPLLFPQPGWSEQRPADWWDSAVAATRAALRRVKPARVKAKGRRVARGRRAGSGNAADVGAIGLSGQMHGSVFLDAKQRVLRNALLWNDQRTAAECREIEERAGGRAELIRLVNNVALTGYTAPKVLWLRNHELQTFAKLRTVLLPKDYIAFRLTGKLGSEVSDASGTLLFDVKQRTWSGELLRRLDLDPGLLPPTVESCEVAGQLTSDAARELGLPAGIPVAAGAGDQAASAVGTGVVRSGIVSATMGTSGVVFAHSDAPVPNGDGLLQSFCHAVPRAWCVFGCMLSAGGSLQWAREVFFVDRLAAAKSAAARDAIYTAMIAEAEAAPLRHDVVFHPYLTGERCPYAHPHARGAFIGTTRADTRGALIRAVLEGITIGMGRQIEIMRGLGVPIREVRLAGGGARNAWWRQLQADVYGARCVA
ncbi:MAG: xylulokinase, partial [Planctomycetota bacterium]